MGLFAAGMAVLLFGPLQPPAAPAENESLAVYTELIEQYIDDLESRPLTNDRGFIVWNLSYVLDSLLNVAVKYRDRVEQRHILPKVTWRAAGDVVAV